MAGKITRQVKFEGAYFVQWGNFLSLVTGGSKGRMHQAVKSLGLGSYKQQAGRFHRADSGVKAGEVQFLDAISGTGRSMFNRNSDMSPDDAVALNELKAANPLDTIELNPSRYPKHEDKYKGQLFGGECNRTACNRIGAVWWNMGTFGLYCTHCARGLDRRPNPLYLRVEEKPKLADMEKFKRDNGYYDIDFNKV